MRKIKFMELLAEISLEVHENFVYGNFDEKDYQKAFGYELTSKKIEYMREMHIELFYKKIPIKLGAPDFFLNKKKPPTIIELKLGSCIEDSNRHQLKMYLSSIRRGNNQMLKNVKDGYIINFLKSAPLVYLDDTKLKNKTLHKVEIELFKLNYQDHLVRLNVINKGAIKV